jgi:hypothetical protein
MEPHLERYEKQWHSDTGLLRARNNLRTVAES